MLGYRGIAFDILNFFRFDSISEGISSACAQTYCFRMSLLKSQEAVDTLEHDP